MSVNVEEMAQELAKSLGEYDQEVADGVKKAVSRTAAKAAKELRITSPQRYGEYAQGWRNKTAYESRYEKRNAVFNKDHYQLTHLLEKGHVRKNTDRARVVHISKTKFTKARVHIRPVEQRAMEDLEKNIKKAVEK